MLTKELCLEEIWD